MSNTPSKKDVDDLVYALRQKGDDSTYALVVEAIAKWGTPQPSDCTRSHPHEDMSGYCLLRTEIARLANENARLKASQPVVREMECTCSAKDAPFSTCCKVREAFEQWYDSQEYGRLQPFDVFKGGWVSRGITQKGGSNGL